MNSHLYKTSSPVVRWMPKLALVAVIAALSACAGTGGSQSAAGESRQRAMAEWAKFKEAWNNHDPAGIAGAFQAGGIYNNPSAGGPLTGPAIAQFTGALFTGVPDFKVQTVSSHFVNENLMAVRWVITGTWTQPFPRGPLAGATPTGKSFSVPGASFYEWSDGKIKRYDAYFDRMSLLTQIGAIQVPPAK